MNLQDPVWGDYDLGMTFDNLLLTAQYWVYRTGHYLLTNVMDDPAWLALIFC